MMTHLRIVLLAIGVAFALSAVIAQGGEPDCNNNGVPDSMELEGNDCDDSGVLDVCENGTLANVAEFSGPSPFYSGGFSGGNVVIDGDRAAVGDPGYRINGVGAMFGRVQIFKYAVESGWSFEEEIVGPQPLTAYQAFGDQVALSGDRLVVTMPGNREGSNALGVVFTYRRIDGQWELAQTLESPFKNVFFGQQVALLANRLFVQIDYFSTSPPNLVVEPRVEIYVDRGNGWENEQTIIDGSTLSRQRLTSGERAFTVIGDQLITLERENRIHHVNGDYIGLSYLDNLVFRKWSNGKWAPSGRVITWLTPTSSVGFGFSDIAINEDDMVIGYPNLDRCLVAGRQGDEWVVTDQTSSIGGDWVEQIGTGFWVGNGAATSNFVYDLHITPSGPTAMQIPELAGELGVGNRSGNWWIYKAGSNPELFARIKRFNRDCDEDGIPDHCEIEAGAADVDGNGVPDDCELDCNADGIPDASQLQLGDCNANGVLDICDVGVTDPDGDGQTWADCNQNQIPDACESDCDRNGVPDVCDLDPTDPDGNGMVGEDCDLNGVPDACDRRGALVQSAVLRPSGDFAGLSYGAALSVDVDVAAIGAPATDSESGAIGRVYVYRLGTKWEEETVIVPGSPDDNGFFGEKVRIHGDTLVIGGRRGNIAIVFIYEYANGVWAQQQVIELPESSAFKYQFSLDQDRLAVAADVANTLRIYERANGVWVLANSIFEAPGAGVFEGDVFLNGDNLYVRYQSGRLIIYRNEPFGWFYLTELKGLGSLSQYVMSMDVNNGLILFGEPARRCDVSSFICGGYKVSRLVERSAYAESIVINPDAMVGEPPNLFGSSIVGFDNRVVVGAPRANADAGSIYYYELDGADWVLRQTIESPFESEGLQFGDNLAVGANSLFVTASKTFLTSIDTDQDAVVVYSIDRDVDRDGVFDGCQPDCDGNLIPDSFEIENITIDGFVAALLHDGPACVFDMNDDGALNGLDVMNYVALLLN